MKVRETPREIEFRSLWRALRLLLSCMLLLLRLLLRMVQHRVFTRQVRGGNSVILTSGGSGALFSLYCVRAISRVVTQMTWNMRARIERVLTAGISVRA